jgi:hypothetical protein
MNIGGDSFDSGSQKIDGTVVATLQKQARCDLQAVLQWPR